MQSAAYSERVRRWRKRASVVAFVAWWGICLTAASTTCVAESATDSEYFYSTRSQGAEAKAVYLVDQKKCESKVRADWSEPEQWAWKQICQHLNVDFDERDANRDEEVNKEPTNRDLRYRRKLEDLQKNYKNPEKLATNESRMLSGKFLAMIFGDPELTPNTWNVPLKFFGFSTDQLVIDTAALRSLDIRNAYVERFIIRNTTVGDLWLNNVHSTSIKLNMVTAKRFRLENVSVAARNFGPAQTSLNYALEPDGALEIKATRIEDWMSITEGRYDAIDLNYLKVGDLFINRPAWNSSNVSNKPQLSITQSVDNGVFIFQVNPEALPNRINLNQFIFANAYLGPDPMPVIKAMDADATDADATNRTSGRPDLAPYELIAKSYAQRGETRSSDRILIAKNDREWHLASILSLDFVWFVWLTFTWLVAVYGFYPELGFAWIGAFVALGWVTFWHASDRLAKDSYRPKPEECAWLASLLLALDSVIPGIHLDKHHEDVRYNGWPQYMLYLLRILGAVLVFVAFYFLQKRLLG